MNTRPKTLVFDLDDTLLDENPGRMLVRRLIMETLHQAYPEHSPEVWAAAYDHQNVEFWRDPQRHALGRLDMAAARYIILTNTLAEFELTNESLLSRLTHNYMAMRDQALILFPGVWDTLTLLRQCYTRFGLLTNGAAAPQRAKIERFNLTQFFDYIQIEGEFGKGKPDPDVYRHILRQLASQPEEAVMIGNDWRADIAPALALGLRAIYLPEREFTSAQIPEEGKGHPNLRVATGVHTIPKILETWENAPSSAKKGC